jgi:hypothetical protein
VRSDRAASEKRLDELYRERPGDFVARRNELVKELRADGDRDEAERLRKLRRPSVTAWLINRVALDSPQLLDAFAAASQAVEDAQRRALEGNEEATTEWRAAADREREATAAIADTAERVARDAGQPASPRALELLDQTLRAAAGDPKLRDRVVGGRVEREQSAATLGLPAGATPTRRAAKAATRQGVAQARRERKHLEGELAKATAREERLRDRVEEATEGLRRDKAKLAESKRETAALRRKLKAFEHRARD